MGFREKSGQRLSTQPNLSGLPAGTYLIRYTTAAGIRTAVVVYCGRSRKGSTFASLQGNVPHVARSKFADESGEVASSDLAASKNN